MDILLLTIVGLLICLLIFVIVSIVLFVKDNIASKKEGRSVNKVYKVMFIISMSITGLLIMVGILLFVLSVLIVRGM